MIIIENAKPYRQGDKRCNLCSAELHNILNDRKHIINRRNEIDTECKRRENTNFFSFKLKGQKNIQ